jgi:hypothetical protein
MWLCHCSCGKTKEICGTRLLTGVVKSCGCLQQNIRNTNTPLNKLYKQYQKDAKRRNFVFELTLEQFNYITTQACFYCNQLPRSIIQTKTKQYIYNGIDRRNNEMGYLLKNSVPCCKLCNYSKNSDNEVEFFRRIHRIYHKHCIGMEWLKHAI